MEDAKPSRYTSNNFWNVEKEALRKLGKYPKSNEKGLKFCDDNRKKIKITEEIRNTRAENHRPGTITSIELQNFMNHASFTFTSINPNVNIISGNNGAGKSSIAQAVVLGLGGSTKSIKRHSIINQYVKHDTNKAEISITLFNEGDDGYQHDIYGNSITFNRTINRNGAALFCLKNENQHVVCSGKTAFQEAEKIHEHFNINLGNPLTVLHQEVAKQFFMREDLKSSLYEFVMQSTLLKTIQDEYRDSKTELDMASHQVMEKTRHLEEHEQDLQELNKKYNNYHKFCANDKLRDTKTREMVKWGFATQCKEKYDTIKMKYDKITKEKEYLEAVKMSCCEKIDECENKLKDKEFENANLKDSVLRFEDELNKSKKNIKESEFRLNDLEAERKENAVIKDELKYSIQEISNKINTAKKSRFHSHVEETEFNKNKAENDQILEKLQSERTEKEVFIKGIGSERAKLHDKLKLIDEKEAAIERSITSYREEMKDAYSSIEKVTSENMNRFGSPIQKLLEKIAQNRHLFTTDKPPIGPVGKFIHLKGEAATTSKLGDLLEVELGISVLKAFLCNCTADRRKLEELMRPLFFGTNMKMPIIYTRKFSGQKYPQVQIRKDHPCVMNFIEIDNPDVFNLLVDEKNIDRVLILTVPKIEAMFMKWFTVPVNTLYAITLDFYRYYPQKKDIQNYSSYHMNYNPNYRKRFPNLLAANNNDEVLQMKENISAIQGDIERLQDTRKPFSGEKIDLKNKIEQLHKEFEDAKNDIRSILTKEAQFKSVWNKDIEEHNKLKDLEGPLLRLKAKYSQALNDKREIEKAKLELQTKIKDSMNKAEWAKDKIEQVLNESQDDAIADLKRTREGHSRKFDQYQKGSIEKTQTLEACRLDLEECYNTYKDAEKEALKFSNGKKPDINLQGKEVEAIIEEERRKKAEIVAAMKGQTVDGIQKSMFSKERQVKALREGITDLKDKLARLEEMVDRRRRLTIKLRSAMFRQVSRNFTSEMENCNLDAKLTIEYKHKSIEISAKPYTGNNESSVVDARDLSSLSGGERSKTLLCFIKGLWSFQYSPFRFMDEWNVYVDDYARPALENMLVMHSLKNNFQCFLISPRNSDVTDFDEEDQDCITFVKVGKK